MSAQGSTIDPMWEVDAYERGSPMTLPSEKGKCKGRNFLTFSLTMSFSFWQIFYCLCLALYLHIMLSYNVYSYIVQVLNRVKDFSKISRKLCKNKYLCSLKTVWPSKSLSILILSFFSFLFFFSPSTLTDYVCMNPQGCCLVHSATFLWCGSYTIVAMIFPSHSSAHLPQALLLFTCFGQNIQLASIALSHS